MEGHGEQPLLAAVGDAPDEVEERLRQQPASLDHANPTDLLDDVQAVGLPGRGGRMHGSFQARDELPDLQRATPAGRADVVRFAGRAGSVVSSAPDDIGCGVPSGSSESPLQALRSRKASTTKTRRPPTCRQVTDRPRCMRTQPSPLRGLRHAGDRGEERLAGRDAFPQGGEHLGDACRVALTRA